MESNGWTPGGEARPEPLCVGPRGCALGSLAPEDGFLGEWGRMGPKGGRGNSWTKLKGVGPRLVLPCGQGSFPRGWAPEECTLLLLAPGFGTQGGGI